MKQVRCRFWLSALGVGAVMTVGASAQEAANGQAAASYPAAPTTAAAPAPSPSRSDIDALLDRITLLEQKVLTLERQLSQAAGAPAAAPPPASPALAPASLHAAAASAASQLPPPALSALQGLAEVQYPSLRIHGFADVNFSETDAPQPGGFSMGQLVLHFASALAPRVSVFAETSLAPRSGAPYSPDVERALIRYDFADRFKLSFGRYHTPIGYWNNAYHHGLFLQTTISRPEMIQFGTVLQPVHFVGLLAEGTVPGDALGLGYSVGLGNGRGSALRDAGDAGDSNTHRAWLANVHARPAGVNALQFGASLYRDRISRGGQAFDEWITGAHLAWTNETPEIIAEFTNVRHSGPGAARSFDTPTYYVQTAYRLPWQNARWKPYYRYDRVNAARAEPVIGNFDLRQSTLGMRFDVADFAAFKGEYRHTRRRQVPTEAGFFLQTSFTF